MFDFMNEQSRINLEKMTLDELLERFILETSKYEKDLLNLEPGSLYNPEAELDIKEEYMQRTELLRRELRKFKRITH